MLAIYKQTVSGTYVQVNENGISDGYYPVATTHDGLAGQVAETELFIRADKNSEYYTDIIVAPDSLTSPDDTIGTATGWGVKLSVGSAQPTEAQWSLIDYANTISITDIGDSGGGDTSIYRPFWYRIECPAGSLASNKKNIVFVLSYTANAVP